MNWRWVAGVFLALLLVVVPMQCYRDAAEWKGRAQAALEEKATFQGQVVALEQRLADSRQVVEKEQAARRQAEAEATRARSRAAALRPTVERQVETLPDSGAQVRQLLVYMDQQVEGLTAQVKSLEVELVHTREQVVIVTQQRDVALARVLRLEEVLGRAPLLQPGPRRKLLWLFPHPGDAVVFVAGGVLACVLTQCTGGK